MIIVAEGIPVTTSVVGVVTALATLLTAVSLLAGTLPALIRLRREVKEGRAEVRDVHKIVNQQRTDGLNFQRALIRALQDAGVAVPVDQSIAEGGASKLEER